MGEPTLAMLSRDRGSSFNFGIWIQSKKQQLLSIQSEDIHDYCEHQVEDLVQSSLQTNSKHGHSLRPELSFVACYGTCY